MGSFTSLSAVLLFPNDPPAEGGWEVDTGKQLLVLCVSCRVCDLCLAIVSIVRVKAEGAAQL